MNRIRAFEIVPNASVGIFFTPCWHETVLAEHDGRVARPNRSESWVLPLRQSVASTHVIAADAVLGEFEEKTLYSKNACARFFIIGCAISASDGSSPQVYVRLLEVGHRLEIKFKEKVLYPKGTKSNRVRGVYSPLERDKCRSPS